MSADELIPRQWYWIRRSDGSLAPYVFHRMGADAKTGQRMAEFFVGSFIEVFRLNQVVGEAHMPLRESDGRN